MYIISFTDNKTGEIITKKVLSLTDKNITLAKNNFSNIDYLFEEALKIHATNITKRYTTFYKTKRNGKHRRIDIPDDNLKKYMRDVNYVFTNLLGFIFPDYIYAYVKKRSAKQAAQKHIGAYAIIKFDIENFFGNCTLENVMKALQIIYPFCLIDTYKLETIIKACMINYDGNFRLPQGAPSSPLISNLTMIPIDTFFASNASLTYTRFADDITFSAKYKANVLTFNSLLKSVSTQLEAYGFNINYSKSNFLKTYYGNVKILGISVGKKEIKIGNKNKQHIKAKIWNFLKDTSNGKTWSKKDVQQLEGQVSQLKLIEPDFINSIIKKYEFKTKNNYKKSVKKILCSK